MKRMTRYIVDHTTIASKDLETDVITISSSVERIKGITFNEEDFRIAEDGSNTRSELLPSGDILRINYMYYVKELIETNNGKYYRSEYNAMRDGYVKCKSCDKWVNSSRAFIFRNAGTTGYFCSNECFTRAGLKYCSYCRKLHPAFYFDNPITRAGNPICNDCFNNHYATCQGCGEWRLTYDLLRAHDGNCYCPSCFSQLDESDYEINSYHTAKNGNRWRFLKTEKDSRNFQLNNPLFYIGTELEVESRSCSPEDVAYEARKYLNKTQDGQLAHFEHDGSLDDGVEIIFNPMTLNYIYEHENLFKKAFERISDMARSHDTSSCGLHIHYSRAMFSKSNIVRLVYLFEKFKENIKTFSRRRGDRIDRWAKFYNFYTSSVNYESGYNIDTFVYIRNHIDWDADDRYRAINLQNYDTVEVRIFRGTLKFSTYMASIEFVNNIMQIALQKSDVEVSNMSFEDIVNFYPTRYLKEYCIEKELLKGDKETCA